MKKTYLLSLLILLFITACQDVDDTSVVLSNSKKKQPVIIVNANRHLKIPEFWIDKIDNANKVIMSDKEISKFNDYTAGSSWVKIKNKP